MRRSAVPLGEERGRRANDHRVNAETRDAFYADCHATAEWRMITHEIMDMDVLQPQDWPEAAPHAVGSSTIGTQARFTSIADDQPIPATVDDVVEHMQLAMAMDHPRDAMAAAFGADRRYERMREAELRAAARWTVAAGHEGPRIVEERVERYRRWQVMLRQLSARLFRRFAPEHILRCPMRRTNPALAAALVVGLGLRDLDAPLRMVLGCPVAGDLPPTRVWDEGRVPRPLGLDFDDLPHAAWNRWLVADAQRRFAALCPRARADHDAMWAKSVAERDAGLCEGPFTPEQVDTMFGPEHWRGSRRFPIWQKGKLRVVDDAAEDLSNGGSNQYDKMRTSRPDFPAHGAELLGRAIERLESERGESGEAAAATTTRGPAGSKRVAGAASGTGSWAAEHGSDDVAAFYRVVLVATRGYVTVVVVDPATGRAMVFVPWGFQFGKVAAVLYCCAVAALRATVARRLFGCVTDHFFDDFSTVALTRLRGVAIVGADAAAQGAVGCTMSGLGYGFSSDKHESTSAVNVFGGVETDMSRVPVDATVSLRVSERAVLVIAELCNQALVRCPPPAAASLAGKVIWVTMWSDVVALRAMLQTLQERAAVEDVGHDDVTHALRVSLEFLRDVLPRMPPMVRSLVRGSRTFPLIWSDAMYECGAPLEDGGGFVVITRRPGIRPLVFLGAGHTPQRVRSFFVRYRQRYSLVVCTESWYRILLLNMC